MPGELSGIRITYRHIFHRYSNFNSSSSFTFFNAPFHGNKANVAYGIPCSAIRKCNQQAIGGIFTPHRIFLKSDVSLNLALFLHNFLFAPRRSFGQTYLDPVKRGAVAFKRGTVAFKHGHYRCLIRLNPGKSLAMLGF